MSIAVLKKELMKFDNSKLIEMMLELYKKNKSVQEYFDFFINPDENKLFEKYSAKVYEAFFPKRGDELKLKEGRQAISDFKKLEPSAELLVTLMLFYVECGVKFTKTFGDINEAFYSSIESMYEQSLRLMREENILDKFQARSLKIVDHSQETGWGFYDCLADTHFEYFPGETGDD
jgi:hypothetical protein